jgi:hypothetical protein
MVFASSAVIPVIGWPRIVASRSSAPIPFLLAWIGIYAVMLTSTAFRLFDRGFYRSQPLPML